MKLNSANKQNAILWSSSLIFLLMVVSSVLSQKFIILFFPIAFIIITGIFFKPPLIPIVLMISLFIGIPIREHGSISLKVADLMFLLVVFGIFANRNQEQTEFELTESIKKIFYIFFFFFLSCVLSVVLNLNKKEAVDIATSVWYLLSLLEVIAIILFFSQNRMYYFKEPLITTFLMVSFFEQIIGLLQYFQLGTASIDSMRGVQGTFTHHAMFGNMMTIALSLCLYRLLNSSSLRLKFVYGIGIILSVYTMIISGSRSGLLGLILSLVFFTVSQFKIKKRYFIYLGVLIVFGLLIIYFTPINDIIKNTVKNEHTNTIDLSSYLRLLIWKGTILHFLNGGILQKLFGIGFGNFYTIIHPYILLSNSKHAAGAHNNYLHVLSETGVLGFIVFMYLFGTIIFKLLTKSKQDKLAFSFLFATIALLSSGMTQETFWFQPDFGTFWMCYAIFLSFIFNNNSNTLGKHNEPKQDTIYI